MNRHSWACGFVLLAAISANAQDLSESSRENLDIALNPPVPIVELLRQAEAGDKYAQHSVAPALLTALCLRTMPKRSGGAYTRLATGSLQRKIAWDIDTSTDWRCLRIMGKRCVCLAAPLSRNFHQPSTISPGCINTATACHRTSSCGRLIGSSGGPRFGTSSKQLGGGISKRYGCSQKCD